MPWPLITAIASISVVGLATGVTLPLVSLRLTHEGVSAATIATMAALPAVGTLGISLCLSSLTRAFGSQALLIAALALSCASVLMLASPYAPLPWAASRLAMGVATGILFALGESRILETSSDEVRGRWTGLYASTLTGCQLAGPALLALLGPQSRAPIVIAAAMHVLAIALLGSVRWQRAPAEREPPLPAREFLRNSLPLAVAVLFFAMFDSTVLSDGERGAARRYLSAGSDGLGRRPARSLPGARGLWTADLPHGSRAALDSARLTCPVGGTAADGGSGRFALYPRHRANR